MYLYVQRTNDIVQRGTEGCRKEAASHLQIVGTHATGVLVTNLPNQIEQKVAMFVFENSVVVLSLLTFVYL